MGRSLLVDGLHLFALAGFVVAQPLFDQLARAPAFFHVRRAGAADVLVVTLVLALGVPALLVALEVAAGLLGARVRRVVHAALVGLLVAVMVLPVLGRHVTAAGPVLAAVAGGMGLAALVAYVRLPGVQSMVSVLALGVPLFVVVFLARSPVAALPRSALVAGVGRATARTTVVVVVFDEFAATALMDEEGQIDARRFPNFAAFAGEATWFRNATTVASLTEAAVGAILTGTYPRAGGLDWDALLGRNLFALLAPSHDLRVVEPYVPFCPASLCPDALAAAPLAERVGPLLSDLAITFAHLVAPPDMRERLPGLSHPLLLLGQDAPEPRGGIGLLLAPEHTQPLASSPVRRGEDVEQFVARMAPSARPSLYYLHVLLPHEPSLYLASGKLCPAWPFRDAYAWGGDPFQSGQAYYRYLQQVQYVDGLVGRLVSRLKAVGLYESTLLVISADHGSSFRTQDHRRALTATNQCDILAVPLFVKTPGQRRGGVSDRNVESIDILPTIAEVVGARIPWAVDGQSLLRAGIPERPTKTVVGSFWPAERAFFAMGPRRALPPRLAADCLDLGEKRALVTAGAAGGLLLRVGPYGKLSGRPAPSSDEAPAAPFRVRLANAGLYPGHDPAARSVPCTVMGELDGPVGKKPIDLAIAVNGTIAAVTIAARLPVGGLPRFAAPVPEGVFQLGDNAIDVFAVSGEAAAPRFERVEEEDGRRWLLREAGDAPAIVAGDGTVIPVKPRMVDGAVDTLAMGDMVATVRGWAVDARNGLPAESVLAFVDGQFQHRARAYWQRQDVQRRYHRPELGPSGFEMSLFLAPDQVPVVRVFALSRDGFASELVLPHAPEPPGLS